MLRKAIAAVIHPRFARSQTGSMQYDVALVLLNRQVGVWSAHQLLRCLSPSCCAGDASLTPCAQHPSHPDRPYRPSTKTPVQLAMPAQQAALLAGASMTVMGWGLLSSGE